MSLLTMLPTTVTLQRQTTTKDLGGGKSTTWSDVTTDIPCDIQPASANIVLNYHQRQLQVSHTIYFNQDVGALATDRFISGSTVYKLVGYRKASPGRSQWPSVADVLETAQS